MKKTEKNKQKNNDSEKNEIISINKYVKEIDKLKGQLKQFSSLIDATGALSSTLELKSVLDIIMRESREVLHAEASSLLLLDKKNEELEFYIAQGDKGEAVKNIRLKMGQGIAGWVAETGESVLVRDALKDDRFFKGADEKTKFKTKSLIAVALKGNRGVVGVVEVLNKIGAKSFTKTDLKILEAFAIQAGFAIENARLYEMAITDGMTKLYIKRFFTYRLEEELLRARRYKNKLGLLIIDIDHFKKVNDTHGHQAGDKVIIEVANILKDTARNVDIPCRYGGEELALIAPETGKEGMLILAERLRKRIEDAEIDVEGKIVKITVSVGCVVYPDCKEYENPDELVKCADSALYYGKENGRNAVTMFDCVSMKVVEK
jgi:diguanylate cyclase (GGDEF)-like protein